MIKIAPLSSQPCAVLMNVFNAAFSDYAVPVEINLEQLQDKIHTCNIQLGLSPGAFVDDRLVGFIWHGFGMRHGRPVVWNGGTGVIPEYRGQGISAKLYEYILPKLRERGYERTVLEVIDNNEPAIATYKKVGFKIVRTLDCFRGRISQPTAGYPGRQDQRILEKPLPWAEIQRLCKWRPTFQNNNARMDLLDENVTGVGLYEEQQLIAFILYDTRWDYGDVYQFGVHESYRRRGIGTYLFSIAQKHKTVPLKIINVDTKHGSSIAFFESLGFEKILSQYEMLREI